MFLADVIGTVVSPVQHPVLEGRRLLLVRPVSPLAPGLAAEEARPLTDRTPRIAIDPVGAGIGERVLVADEGNTGRQVLDAPDMPVKTVVMGIVDYVEVEDRLRYGSTGAGTTADATSVP